MFLSDTNLTRPASLSGEYVESRLATNNLHIFMFIFAKMIVIGVTDKLRQVFLHCLLLLSILSIVCAKMPLGLVSH